MNEEFVKELEGKLTNVIDSVLEKRLGEAVSPIVASETRRIVEQMRVERALFGQDRSGLTDSQKIEFAKAVRNAPLAGISTKANEALIEETDSRGGYLVPKEVAQAIVRIASSVGLVLSQATKWDMKSNELGIPAYTGAFLEGEYLGVDSAGSVTGLTFETANLIAKKWQLAFVVGNDLLEDASVNLADWLLALGAEALANRIDKEAIAGTGAPFTGVFNHPQVTTQVLDSGKTAFTNFDIDEISKAIGGIEESVLEGAGFYFNRSVWALIRANLLKTGFSAVDTQVPAFQQYAGQVGGPKPVGSILGYPVYTTRHLPDASASGADTKFAIFGNFKAVAYGDKGELRVGQFSSGSFGGKEVALADQTGIVYKHRHALVVTLPAAFVVIKTATS
jgi:HK97 family phage major capsid protein